MKKKVYRERYNTLTLDKDKFKESAKALKEMIKEDLKKEKKAKRKKVDK